MRYYYSASNERALHLGLNLFYHNIIFLLRFRMVNILLPAYGRHYSALRGAGLAMAADEMENHELENLVLRERGVVWADQEEVGQQLKGERTGVDLQETNEVGSAGLCSELAPILSFSHLQYHQNSPCSKSPYSHHPVYSPAYSACVKSWAKSQNSHHQSVFVHFVSTNRFIARIGFYIT